MSPATTTWRGLFVRRSAGFPSPPSCDAIGQLPLTHPSGPDQLTAVGDWIPSVRAAFRAELNNTKAMMPGSTTVMTMPKTMAYGSGALTPAEGQTREPTVPIAMIPATMAVSYTHLR